MLVLKYIFQICVFYGRRTKLEIVLKLILFKYQEFKKFCNNKKTTPSHPKGLSDLKIKI